MEYFCKAKFMCLRRCGHPRGESRKTHYMKTPLDFQHMLSLMFKKTAEDFPQRPCFTCLFDYPCAPTEIALGQEPERSFSHDLKPEQVRLLHREARNLHQTGQIPLFCTRYMLKDLSNGALPPVRTKHQNVTWKGGSDLQQVFSGVAHSRSEE